MLFEFDITTKALTAAFILVIFCVWVLFYTETKYINQIRGINDFIESFKMIVFCS